MSRVTAHGNLRAVLIALRNQVAQCPAANPPHWAQARTGSCLLEANVQKINLDLSKLNIHRPSLAEIALRERAQKVQAKSTPYTSKHGVSGVELNGQVPVKLEESSSLAAWSVVCRHLAAMFWQHGGKKSELMQAFATEAGIAKMFDGKLAEIDVGIKKAIKEAPAGCKHLFSSERLGGYLQVMATQLQAPGAREGPSEANCLLNTASHAMALHLQRKRKDGVEYFSAKLYDPNQTATYKRVVMADPENFGSLKLQDMMVRPQLISLYARGANKPLSMVAVSMDHRLQPPMDRSSIEPSAENMYLALKMGLPDELRSMIKAALGGRQEFAQAFLTSNLSPHAKVELLAAKSSNGVPGLFLALKRGHPDVVQAFTQGVLASKELNPQEKFDLLVASFNGVPGLFYAFGNGHTETVKVFAQPVLASNDFSPQAKVDLLAARYTPGIGGFLKHRRGLPGLALARQERQDETVRVFTQIVRQSSLSEDQKAELLSTLNSSDKR